MPWSLTSPMDQKMLFLTDCVRELIPIAESCRRYGISRKTGYKWIERFKEHGAQGLLDRSRRPHHLARSSWLTFELSGCPRRNAVGCPLEKRVSPHW
jgi:putative transposase